jgi:hypothetical protein
LTQGTSAVGSSAAVLITTLLYCLVN